MGPERFGSVDAIPQGDHYPIESQRKLFWVLELEAVNEFKFSRRKEENPGG